MATLSLIGSKGEDLQTITDRRRKVAAATVENCRLSGAVATVHRRRTATVNRIAATALRLAATACRLSNGEEAVDMERGRRLTEGWSATM